jgi:hypothetical protein
MSQTANNVSINFMNKVMHNYIAYSYMLRNMGHYYQPQSRCQSLQWKHLAHFPPRNSRLSCWLGDFHWPLSGNLRGQLVISTSCCDVLHNTFKWQYSLDVTDSWCEVSLSCMTVLIHIQLLIHLMHVLGLRSFPTQIAAWNLHYPTFIILGRWKMCLEGTHFPVMKKWRR